MGLQRESTFKYFNQAMLIRLNSQLLGLRFVKSYQLLNRNRKKSTSGRFVKGQME